LKEIKKKMFLLLTCLVLQLITTIDCLNQNDLCKRRINEKRCQILNETAGVECISDTSGINDCALKSEWKIKCGHSYCSKDTLSCEIFKMNMNKVEEKEKKIKKEWKDKLIIRNYLNFKNEIKNCPSVSIRKSSKKNETFQWKLSDVCDNQNKFDCNGGRLSHKCIDLFCVSDKIVCMGFTSLLSDISFDIKKMTQRHQIRKCLPNRKF